jgi:hypothetical protein
MQSAFARRVLCLYCYMHFIIEAAEKTVNETEVAQAVISLSEKTLAEKFTYGVGIALGNSGACISVCSATP